MINEACKCGHDKATHFEHQGVRGVCLGMRCDCPKYRTPEELDTVKTKAASPYVEANENKPHSGWFCTCEGCQRWKRRQSW